MSTKNQNKQKETSYNPEVTEHDKEIIGEKRTHIRGDGGDDSILYDRPKPVDFAGKDLDIPGRDLPNKHSSTKLKSEENQHHSLGSSHNEELERDEDLPSKNHK